MSHLLQLLVHCWCAHEAVEYRRWLCKLASIPREIMKLRSNYALAHINICILTPHHPHKIIGKSRKDIFISRKDIFKPEKIPLNQRRSL